MNLLKTSIAAAALAAFLPMAAQAALALKVEDLMPGGSSITVTDGSMAPGATDFNSTAGAITWVGAIGSWSLNASTGFGTATNAGPFGIDLNSINSSSTGGTLRLSFTETDINYGTLAPSAMIGEIGGVTGGTVKYWMYVDDANVQFGQGAMVFSGQAGPGAFADSGWSPTSLTNPFSMTLVVEIMHAGPNTTSFNFDSSVPEPGVLALTSLALLGAGWASRRRKA